ncbi:MAG: c-type cytochrome [Pseudomonadales bacterium]
MTIKPLLSLLVTAQLCLSQQAAALDLDQGATLYQQCAICHSNAAGEPAKIGPNLWAVVGREKAASTGYQGRYSPALSDVGGTWDATSLDAFLTNPQAFAPGTIMGFAGLANAADRANLIAYLNTQSDTPVTLTLTAPAQSATQATPTVAPNIGKLFRAPGAEKTFAYCSACHSERIVTQQGLTREDWEELLEWMVDEQGMDEIPEGDYETVIHYLSEHYGTDRPNFPN